MQDAAVEAVQYQQKTTLLEATLQRRHISLTRHIRTDGQNRDRRSFSRPLSLLAYVRAYDCARPCLPRGVLRGADYM